MKISTTTTYQCEICGMEYNTEAEARKYELKGIPMPLVKIGDTIKFCNDSNLTTASRRIDNDYCIIVTDLFAEVWESRFIGYANAIGYGGLEVIGIRQRGHDILYKLGLNGKEICGGIRIENGTDAIYSWEYPILNQEQMKLQLEKYNKNIDRKEE